MPCAYCTQVATVGYNLHTSTHIDYGCYTNTNQLASNHVRNEKNFNTKNYLLQMPVLQYSTG